MKSTWTYQGKPFDEMPEGKIGFLYLIITPENRYYIGQTVQRTWRKYWGGGSDLMRYYKKHGKDGVKRIALMFFENQNDLDSAERKLVAITGAKENPKYYNLMDGGGSIGLRSKATRARMSKAITGIKKSPEHNEKNRISHQGEKGAMSKLTNEIVTEILRLSVGPDRHVYGFVKIIVDHYGYHRNTINAILWRKSWLNIPLPTEPLRLKDVIPNADEILAEMSQQRTKKQEGSKHFMAKLSEEDVVNILRVSIDPNKPRNYLKLLTDHYPVGEATIRSITARKNWMHIEMPTVPLSIDELISGS